MAKTQISYTSFAERQFERIPPDVNITVKKKIKLGNQTNLKR